MKETDLRFEAVRISRRMQVRTSTLQAIYQACTLAIQNRLDEDESVPEEMIEHIAALHSLIEPMVQPSPAQLAKMAESMGLKGGLLEGLKGALGSGPKGPRR